MHTWHDYHLTGFAVDGAQEKITFNVSWPLPAGPEPRSAVVVFSGVAGYFFEHDLGTNIILSLDEESLQNFLVEHADQFNREAKWGWPLFWQGTTEQTFEHLSARGVRCYELSSSYGLTGWVLAKSFEHREAGA